MPIYAKVALAKALKKQLKSKPLDKISVVSLINDCGVSRQTFYYHFKSISDLVRWIYFDEGSKAIRCGGPTYKTWKDGYLSVFYYCLNNKEFVTNTYCSVSRDEFDEYLYSETYKLLYPMIDEAASGKNISDKNKAFITNFFKFAFVGIVLEWIKAGMKENPIEVVNSTEAVIHGQLAAALARFEGK